jgi:glycerate dehydrogenase
MVHKKTAIRRWKMKGTKKQNLFEKMIMLNFEESNLTPELWARIDKITKRRALLKESEFAASNNLDADCLILKLGMSADRKLIDSMPNLKYIGMYGTGFGRIDVLHAEACGITVCNIADYATEGVAEFVIGCILEYLRSLTRARMQANCGNYSESTFSGSEICGKKFGVIGLGHIGFRVAEIISGFLRSNVGYYDRVKKSTPENIVFTNLNKLLKNSDIISIHLALNEGTNQFFNSSLIKKIKSGAMIINTAPMELFDIDALESRLKKGDITLILDHSDELSTENIVRLSKLPNCIMYPPIGYTTREATEAKKEIFVSNLENYLKGVPTNKVN